MDKPKDEKGGQPKGEGPEKVDFSFLIHSLTLVCFIALGEVPDPSTGKKEKNLEAARQNIDILDLLGEKTRGNLNPDEEELLRTMSAELKMKFVRAAGGKG